MSRLVTLAFAALLPMAAQAIPLELDHSGRLLDLAGAGLNGSHTLTVTLYSAPTGGPGVWTDTLTSNLNDGYFTLTLGTTPGDALSEADFSAGTLYLGIAVDAGPELAPRSALRPTPYAIRARTAEGLAPGGTVQIGDDGNTLCDAGRAGVMQFSATTGLQVCVPPDGWKVLAAANIGTAAQPGTSCKAILASGSSHGNDLYWIDPTGTQPLQVLCDMTTDGGGFTMCARQNFSSPSQYLGNAMLTSAIGTVSVTGNSWSADCAQLMLDVAPAAGVEFMMTGSAQGEWMWVYPWPTQVFSDLLTGPSDATGGPATCTGQAVTECRGSATNNATVATSKSLGCHSYGAHRTGDSYFIFQVSDGQNSNVLLEIGQGDLNHPVGIRPDCGGSSWWGSCGRPAGSFPYQLAAGCASGRERGTVTVGFRER